METLHWSEMKMVKRMKRRILVVIVFILILSGFLFLDEMNNMSGRGLTEKAFAGEVSDPEQTDNANSWRYSNGEPLEKKSLELKRNSVNNTSVTRKGIDVSAWQKDIDWAKVKAAGIDFAILRCGYGGNYTKQDDAYFERNASECERLGIPYGVYLYSYATNTTRAESEADHTLRMISGHKLSYPVYFDMEDNSTIGSNYASIAKTYCNKISAAGYPVGVYANLNWWNNYLTDSCFNQWHKWVAQYNSYCGYKGTYAMWQYTSSGKVNGITGKTDMNYLIGYPKDHGTYNTAVSEGTYTISNKADTNRILSIVDSNTWNGAALEMVAKQEVESNSRFEIISIGNKEYKILTEHAGKALTAVRDSKTSDVQVVQDDWNASEGQKWEFVNAGGGNYYLRSKSGAYLKLDNENGEKIIATAFCKEDAQQWSLNTSDYRPVEDGIYTIQNKSDGEKAIDVSNMETMDRANICLSQFSNALSQQFSVKYIGKGYYQIVAEHSGKSWDVAGGSKDPGANLQQYKSNNSDAQQWKFIKNEDGDYFIKSKLGTAVSSSDSNVQLSNMDTTLERQKWSINKAEFDKIEDGIYSFKNNADSEYAVSQKSGNIQVNTFCNMLEQKFRVERVKDGYYKIIDISSGNVFDIENGAVTAGANLQTHTWNGTDAQLWRFVKTGSDQYLIKSKKGNFIGGVTTSLGENGNLKMELFSKSKSLQWNFTKEKMTYLKQETSDSNQNSNRLFGSDTLVRLGGSDRYGTALMAADAMKKSNGNSKFKTIIIASGADYPDALTGSYLARVKKAPILLLDTSHEKNIIAYINSNLDQGGMVYLLGGTGVVSQKFEKSLPETIKVKRLAGKNRYETNLKILKEAGVHSGAMLICSGNGFADSLSVSSVGLPVLLADNELNTSQQEYIDKADITEFYLIGGTGTVNKLIESECRTKGNVIRLAGWSRYTTSVATAYGFFGQEQDTAVLAYGENFPDGLAGGPVAASISAPVLLTGNSTYHSSTVYAACASLNRIVVLGGEPLINSSVAQKHIQ